MATSLQIDPHVVGKGVLQAELAIEIEAAWLVARLLRIHVPIEDLAEQMAWPTA